MILFLLTSLAFSAQAPAIAQELTPAGYPVTQARYVTMRDDVNIAIDVILPSTLAEGQTVPTLMRMTRYWRAIQNLELSEIAPEAGLFLDAGYALVRVDARGSGASEGTRSIEWSADEVADYGEIVDWIIDQPWSNGRVGAYGVSYDGNTAELLAVPNHPAVKAVAPLYNDFDPATLATPGGVFNRNFIQQWSEANNALDANDICYIADVSGAECLMLRLTVPGVKPVDDDPNGERLAQIIAERNNMDLFPAMQQVEFRDDAFGAAGETLTQVSPYGLRTEIENSGVPMDVWVSWLDAATADGALSRYLTFTNPQRLIIGPWSHGGGFHTDPFLPDEMVTEPSYEEQHERIITFFDYYLKDEGELPAFDITYYTLNANTWTTTSVWPPTDFTDQLWYFAENGTLASTLPTGDATDEYMVDYTVTTGESTRWHTQLGGSDVVYPDRAEQDTRLLTYTSEPMTTAMEITGSPLITLYVASTHADGAFHVYLEDVAPDGRVTYITEGILRAMHRQVSEDAPYQPVGVYHSMERADAAPLIPGEITEINLSLYTTSVRIEQGHRIRIAIAGHDASMFERYPAEGTPVLTMYRSGEYASHVKLPMREYPHPEAAITRSQEIAGVWNTEGYAWTFDILPTGVNACQVTEATCVPVFATEDVIY